MDKAATLQIERKSSIENEPRTLNIDQIQFARVKLSLIIIVILIWF